MRKTLVCLSLCLFSSQALAQTSTYFSDNQASGVIIDRGYTSEIFSNNGTYGTTYTPLPGGPTYYNFTGPDGSYRSGSTYSLQAPDPSQLPISPLPEYKGPRHGIYAPMDPWQAPGQGHHK